MRQVWQHIRQQWQGKLAFRLASTFLVALLVVALVLPWLPLPYGPNQLDLAYLYLPPFEAGETAGQHLLGTDGLGRDVLANLLYGIRTAFFVSLPIMVGATLLGVLLGAAAGFYRTHSLRVKRSDLLVGAFGVACLSYYWLYLPLQLTGFSDSDKMVWISMATGLGLPLLLFAVFSVLHRFIPFLRRRVSVPLDGIVLRLIEALSTVPRFVLILVLASFVPPSVLLLSVIIILTLWTNTARLARAEMLRITQLPYFEAAKSIGLKPTSLIWRQAMPNLLGPVLVSFTFGLGSLLALESTLSFFNIGVPTDFVSWGRTIANVRANTGAWWLVAFPGGLLSLTILALYTCSHYLSAVFHAKKGL